MRISDWSSDVCSSDLGEQVSHPPWSRGGGSAAADGGELVGAGPGVAVGGLHLLRPSREQADELIEVVADVAQDRLAGRVGRSEEHTSELQSLMRISYAVFCLKKKNKTKQLTAH